MRPDHGAPRRTTALLLCWVWVWVSGCDVVGPPSGARRFTPPALYRAWWALTESCSGLRGNFDAVSWYLYRGGDVFALEGKPVNGAWYGAGNRIALGDSEELDGSLVRHEMLHALLQSGEHPRQQFLGNCSDIVVCFSECLAGAGGPPDTSGTLPLLAPALLRASIVVEPDTVSMSADSGWVAVTVNLTNTTGGAGRIQGRRYEGMPLTILALSAEPFLPVEGDIRMDYYWTVAPADSAGSTRRLELDVQLPLIGAAPRYVFTGGLEGKFPVVDPSAASRVVTVVP
jgi:hypothetical protein